MQGDQVISTFLCMFTSHRYHHGQDITVKLFTANGEEPGVQQGTWPQLQRWGLRESGVQGSGCSQTPQRFCAAHSTPSWDSHASCS